MIYPRNCWYVVALPTELKAGDLLPRTICDIPMLLFRDKDGHATAIKDACSHRLAPLSAGVYQDGEVMCRYHGLRFGKGGKCVHNPHGQITDALSVRSWATVERHDLIWLWMGDIKAADDSLIPDLSFIDRTPAHGKFTGYLPTKANFELCTDNILDLTHTDYLHPDTLGGGGLTRAKEKVKVEGNIVTVRWENPNEVAPPALDRELDRPGSLANTFTEVVWYPPAVMKLCVHVEPVDPLNGSPVESVTMHIMTPEGAMKTHYFVLSTRNFRTDDPGYNEALGKFVNNIFATEDKPMLEAQQARMGTGDLWACNPALLPIDNAAVRARRILAHMIEKENNGEAA
ncbi:aromatic ring-hydroxylating dioxygenase subunit alpha [Sphingobium quisquiliarum]|uniref:aromatic ring-hydroxylating dioxygenase subunit alpha n=1 Tax=Sphingobium quisquiliarum TaxID=538379 RepID=UPI0004CEE3E6|nr:aromatic ring-hydroxylating dioxygenase subunit alpha [Sphingobium quisquiliarum]